MSRCLFLFLLFFSIAVLFFSFFTKRNKYLKIEYNYRKARAQQTGRVVPCSVLLEALQQVPKSVEQLAPLVDYHVEVRNASNDGTDIQLMTAGETWDSFRKQWIQYV